MTVPSISTAVSEILKPAIASLSALGIAVFHENLAMPKKPDTKTTYANTVVRHTSGGQATLSDVNGKQRHTGAGYIIVEIFTPAAIGTGEGYDVAEAVIREYITNKSPHGVWFRNHRIDEIGASSTMQLNVVISFNYDFIT